MAELVGLDSEDGPVWNLVYDAKVVDGKEFAPEERKIAFCGKFRSLIWVNLGWLWQLAILILIFSGKNMLIDLESNERRVGGGDLGLMQWRVEGSQDELPQLLPVGLRQFNHAEQARFEMVLLIDLYRACGTCSIKARFKGGDTWYAGKITALSHTLRRR